MSVLTGWAMVLQESCCPKRRSNRPPQPVGKRWGGVRGYWIWIAAALVGHDVSIGLQALITR